MSLLSIGSAVTDWESYGSGTDNDGDYSGAFSTYGLTQAWTYTNFSSDHSTGIYSVSPVVSGGYLYVPASDGYVHCINSTTSSVVWMTNLNSTIVTAPVVYQDILVVPLFNATFSQAYALNATTGDILWNFTLNNKVEASPFVEEGLVFVGTRSAKMFAINVSSGAENWSETLSGGNLRYSAPAYYNGLVVAGLDDGKVRALNSTNGSRAWMYNSGARIQSTILAKNGLVYFGNENSTSSNFYALNATNGSYVWNATLGNAYVSSHPAYSNGLVYVANDAGVMYALNATNGSEHWSYTTIGETYVNSHPVVTNDGKLVFTAQDNITYILNSTSGASISIITLDNQISRQSPIIVNNWLYVADNAQLYAFNAFNVFNGTTYDSTGAILGNSSVNVSYYTLGATGMTYVGARHVWSNNNTGWFSLNLTTNSSWYYKYDVKYWNATNNVVDKVSKPAMYLTYSFMNNLTDMKYYLYDAGIINVTVLNTVGNYITYGYQVRDQDLSFEIQSSANSLTNETTIYVPKDRNYSVMIWPVTGSAVNFVPYSFDVNFSSTVNYNITQYNDGTALSWYNASLKTVYKTFNTTQSQARVYGYVNCTNAGSFSDLSIVPYVLQPGNMLDISNGVLPYNASGWWSESDAVDKTAGSFNISLPYSVNEDVSYMLFFSAKNGSTYYGAWQNVTSLNSSSLNLSTISLEGLFGNTTFINQSVSDGTTRSVNTKFYNFSYVNSTNDSISNVEGVVEIRVNYPGLSAFTFAEQISVGTSRVSVPLLNTSGVEEVVIYSPTYAPTRQDYVVTELTGNGLNVSLNSFNPKKVTGAALSTMVVTVYVSNSTCDVPYPTAGCVVKNFTYSGVADLMSMMPIIFGGGKISMRMASGSVSVTFKNVDLLASGPPDSMYNENSDLTEHSTGSFSKLNKFGSVGPKVYDSVLVAMPYTEGTSSVRGLNESAVITVGLHNLYDESFSTQIWNATLNGTSGVGLVGNYSHYKDAAAWTTLLEGSNCGSSATSITAAAPCYVDTGNNYIWLRLPHFSGTEPSLSGGLYNDTTTTAAASSSSSDDSGGSSTTEEDDEETEEEEDEETEEEEEVVEAELLNGEWTDDGETLLEGLEEGDTFEFSMELENVTHLYNFEVTSVGEDSVVLDVEGEDVTVELGETVTVDLNGDGVDDLEFSLLSIEDGVADIQMSKIAEEDSWFKWWYALVFVLLVLAGLLVWFFKS